MSYRFIKLLWALPVALLLAGAGCKTRPSFQPRSGPAIAVIPAARPLTPLPARALSPEAQELRERALVASAKLRGLDFRNSVGMTELTGWEYGTRTREMALLLGGEDLQSLARLAIAGGMLPPGTDLATLASSFAAASAGATYSPLDKQVLLVSRFKDDSLITHEFVHALQDQHFDLLRLLAPRPFNFDRAEAAFALVEGDAMNVQRRLENREGFDRRTLDEIAQIEGDRFAQYRREVGALFPPLLTETFVFRYRDGARFVEAVRRNKKGGGLDAVFADPPLSTEQILHPEKYFARERPVEVALNIGAFTDQGWTLINSSPLGEIGIRGLLLTSLPEKIAARAAAGWGGDRAFLLENEHQQSLFVWITRWDSPKEAEEFFQAYLMAAQRSHPSDGFRRLNEREFTAQESDGTASLVRRTSAGVVLVRGAERELSFASAAAGD